MSDFPSEQYRLVDTTVRGIPCRVFAENLPCLAELFTVFERHRDDELVVAEDRRLSYGELARLAGRLAARLAEEPGIRAGDRVGLAMANSPEWLIGFVAIASLGAVPVLINPRGAPEELVHGLHSTGCRLWLAEATSLAAYERAAPADALPVLCGDALEAVLQRGGEAALPAVRRDPDDDAILMFTAGTTGHAKAARLSHRAVLTAVKTIEYSGALIAGQMAERYGIAYETLLAHRPAPVTLLVFPLFHVSGCHAVFLNTLAQGGRVVLMPRWDAERALDLIEQEKVTAFSGVPTMYWDLMRTRDFAARDLSSLTSISVGGQATPPALLEAMTRAFANAVPGTGYGLTETSGAVTLAVGDDFVSHPRSVGRAVSTFEIEIRDEERRPLAAGAHGEVFVRGAALMSGYANSPGPDFDTQGWFATGDIGVLDAEGRLSIVDRRTDMVISGGENIYCSEVERALELHPAVRESAAFGEPDERLGERLVALAVLLPDAQASAEDVIAGLESHIARHKEPKVLRLTREPLPRNAAGKVVKAEARELFERSIDGNPA